MKLQSRHKENLFLLMIVAGILAAGTAGYMLIEGWSFLDSLFMTVITLSTVGYQEAHPLSPNGIRFTIILIIGGVSVAGVILSRIIADLFDREQSLFRRRKRMIEKISLIDNHSIFCGYGRIAQVAIKRLHRHHHPIVVIEHDEAKVAEAEELGILCLQGDATLDETLKQAGIERAKQIVSLLNKDADNLYIILAAKELNPEIKAVTRAEYENGESRLIRAGADKVIAPYVVGGRHIAERLLRPHVMNFLELASSTNDSNLVLEELRVPSGSPLHGVALRDSNLREKTNVIIAAIVSPGGETTFNPPASAKLEQGSILIGLGSSKDLESLEKILLPPEEAAAL